MALCWMSCTEWDKSAKDTFTLMDGTKTTFVEYYREHYGITINKINQPLLRHWPKERSKPGGKQIITGEMLLVTQLVCTGLKEHGVDTIWVCSLPLLGPSELPPHLGFCKSQYEVNMAGPHSYSSTMQGCPQTGFPVWSVPSLGTSHPAFR
ncbi:uncharacterized protein [Channa argus]|uniref:uncharacterized protein isoform X1 n=3 Tax=Channa argus TaxID=215402 RepID=UPI00352207DD